uniref:Bursicon n=1 Tax=Plectus sambesii TaxID=2011161 RepID=A0A914V1K3_9BILA
MLLCASLLVRTAFGRPQAVPPVAESSTDTDPDAAIMTSDVPDSYDRYKVAIIDENATNPSTTLDRMSLYRQPLDRAQFAEKSEQAFMALQSDPYEERPLMTPEEKRWRWHQRTNQLGDDGTKLPGKGRKKLPGRGKAMAIASANLFNNKQKCDGELFKQRVRMAGCLSKIVVNKFCHGQCSSFFIPKLRAKKLKAAFQSCAACVPAEYDNIEVTLHCPTRNPPQVTRTVMKVKRCECRALDRDRF